MKFLHLSDLHIGKRVNEFSMLEDQKIILDRIIKEADKQKIDAVIIAGDIYDKSSPSDEAIKLFDSFLTRLAQRNLKVFAISGNHDSAEKVAYASNILKSKDIYISPIYDGEIKPVPVYDDFGKINIWLIPFLKPFNVREYFKEQNTDTYNNAFKTVINSFDIDKSERNIVVAHQFVTGAERSESEEISVGGLDNIDAEVFEDFDYVALGHIHKAQSVCQKKIRYCGTPLKYSFSEVNHKKSVTVFEIKEKGNVEIKEIPLTSFRDMREIKGTYSEITLRDNYKDTNTDDYMHIILTDEEDIPEAIGKLRTIYPNIMKLDYDNKRTKTDNTVFESLDTMKKSPIELFGELYYIQNNSEMSEEQKAFSKQLIEKIWEAEK